MFGMPSLETPLSPNIEIIEYNRGYGNHNLSTGLFRRLVYKSLVLRRYETPQFEAGGGSGVRYFGTSYHYLSLEIQNELRRLAISLPETVIFGTSLKTDFGGHIVERDPARRCMARLLEPSGRHISHLWWFDGQRAYDSIDIKSGESANLIVFLRRENDSNQHFVYQPNSGADPTPVTTEVARFDKTMEFLVDITYSHGSQRLRFPVTTRIDYDGRFRFETQGGLGMF